MNWNPVSYDNDIYILLTNTMRLISTDERYINNSWEQIPKEWSNTTYYHNVFGNIRRKITINTNKGFYQEKNKITMSISIQL